MQTIAGAGLQAHAPALADASHVELAAVLAAALLVIVQSRQVAVRLCAQQMPAIRGQMPRLRG